MMLLLVNRNWLSWRKLLLLVVLSVFPLNFGCWGKENQSTELCLWPAALFRLLLHFCVFYFLLLRIRNSARLWSERPRGHRSTHTLKCIHLALNLHSGLLGLRFPLCCHLGKLGGQDSSSSSSSSSLQLIQRQRLEVSIRSRQPRSSFIIHPSIFVLCSLHHPVDLDVCGCTACCLSWHEPSLNWGVNVRIYCCSNACKTYALSISCSLLYPANEQDSNILKLRSNSPPT